MLEDTLVVWTTEFGRTPFDENPDKAGREHHNRVFSSWLAGGGVKVGTTYGESDDMVSKSARTWFTFTTSTPPFSTFSAWTTSVSPRYSGRDFRLTDVAGEVVKGILA